MQFHPTQECKGRGFGIIYGPKCFFGLSQNLNIPRKEAAEIIDQYFTQYPGIKHTADTRFRS
jgi:DNA polymerase-1